MTIADFYIDPSQFPHGHPQWDKSKLPSLQGRTVDLANQLLAHKNPGIHYFNSCLDAGIVVIREAMKILGGHTTFTSFGKDFGFVALAGDVDEMDDCQRLIRQRQQLKAGKKFQEADEIRLLLNSWGYQLGDSKHGTDWVGRPWSNL